MHKNKTSVASIDSQKSHSSVHSDYLKRGYNKAWHLFEMVTTSGSKSGTAKHTSRSSVTGSQKGDRPAEVDIDKRIESLAQELSALSQAERGAAIPNYITARGQLYKIEEKVLRNEGSSKPTIPADTELHSRAQEFLKKYKSKESDKKQLTPRDVNSPRNGMMESFADYLKSKYVRSEEKSASSGADMKLELGKYRSPQYGYIMAQFKNPEAFPQPEPRRAGDLTGRSQQNAKQSNMISFSETKPRVERNLSQKSTKTMVMPRLLTLKEKGEAKVQEVQKTKQQAATPAPSGMGTEENPHLIEVMVLCDRIRKLEGELGEKGKQIDKLAAELKEVRAQNVSLREENEKLRKADK